MLESAGAPRCRLVGGDAAVYLVPRWPLNAIHAEILSFDSTTSEALKWISVIWGNIEI